MRFFYTFLLALAAPFLLLSLYRAKNGKPKVGKRWVEHFGFTPPLKGALENSSTNAQSETDSAPIWIHAVSVGEVIAAKPFVLALREKYPTLPILITTTTATGAQIAAQLGDDIEHRYMPIDFGFAVKGFLKRTKPQIFMIMETELWPNTLATVKKAEIPIIVINARLSESAMKGYQKIKPLFLQLSQNITHILCQFKTDAQRFKTLGIEEKKLSVCGSVKFDLPVFDALNVAVTDLKKQIMDRPVWIAASTHPGEDEILLKAHKKILEREPHALLILVPRHPERFNNVSNLIVNKGLSIARKSQQEAIKESTQVYLGDTLGEMMNLFCVSDCAFMAGSLLGKKVGGHNLLEPASLGKPILTGPSFYNFQVIAQEMIEKGACIVCQNKEDIVKNVITLFENNKEREKRGQAAREVVENNRGAVEKTMAAIKPWIIIK